MTIYLIGTGCRGSAGLALLASLSLVQGCGQLEPGRVASSTPSPHTTSTVQNQVPVQRESALRVVVKFRSSGTGRDAALLSGLTRQVQAPVSYIASVSPDTHVYWIELAAGQHADELLKRLRAMPGVVFVEIDRPARTL